MALFSASTKGSDHEKNYPLILSNECHLFSSHTGSTTSEVEVSDPQGGHDANSLTVLDSASEHKGSTTQHQAIALSVREIQRHVDLNGLHHLHSNAGVAIWFVGQQKHEGLP